MFTSLTFLTYIYVKKRNHMVLAKTKLFETELRECAAYFKALSHPARLAILKYVSDTQTCITGDISDSLPLSRTTVNQHLKELKKVGLIKGQVEGINTKYCLNKEKVEELKSLSGDFLNEIKVGLTNEC